MKKLFLLIPALLANSCNYSKIEPYKEFDMNIEIEQLHLNKYGEIVRYTGGILKSRTYIPNGSTVDLNKGFHDEIRERFFSGERIFGVVCKYRYQNDFLVIEVKEKQFEF